MSSNLDSVWVREEKHIVRLNEIDLTGSMSFDALLQLMQEVAWNNSQSLNYSVYDLMKRGLTWVVYRMQFQVKRYPKHYEKITLQSWPSGADRLYVYRDYHVMDESGNVLVTGTSAWLMIHIEKKRPVSINDHYKLQTPNGITRLPLNKSKIKTVESENSMSIEVGYTDIDVNLHTNNTNYIKWALESFYRKKGGIKKPSSLDMIFKGESTLSDHLKINQEESANDQVVFTIVNETKGNVTFQAEIRVGI